MFEKNRNNQEPDALDERIHGLRNGLRASAKLKEAAINGEWIVPVVRTRTHVWRFAKAVAAYILTVSVVIGCALFVPHLFSIQEGPVASNPSETTVDLTNPPVSATETTTTVEKVSPANKPYWYGSDSKALEDLLNGLNDLHCFIDQDSIRSEGLEFWYDATHWAGGGLATWFDGSHAHELISGGEEICGIATITDEDNSRVYFEFNHRDTMRVEAYTVSISELGHPETYSDVPMEWMLYATNDPTLPLEQWVELDYVYYGCVDLAPESDNTPGYRVSGYAIDSKKQGNYQYYCWDLGYTSSEVIEITEFALYGTVE